MDLKTPIRQAGAGFRFHARRLEKLGINVLEDLLYHIPLRYEDLSIVSKIGIAQAGETVTVQGKVEDIKNDYTRRRFRIQRAIISDETGQIECIWFNQPFILKSIKKGDFVSIAGKIEKLGGKFSLEVKEYDVLKHKNALTIHSGRLVPIHPATKGMSPKWLRIKIYEILENFKEAFFEYLPSDLLKRHNLLKFGDAIQKIHFPNTYRDAEAARARLAFDELFLTRLAALARRSEWESKKVTNRFRISEFRTQIKEFWSKLPFELTNSQKKAVREIFQDLAKDTPMNRLLEGDVGSGKTVVSAVAMYVAHLNGFQSVLMAPTEILANQHYNTISSLLEPLGVNVGLITRSKKIVKVNQELGIKNEGKDQKEKSLNSSFIIHNSKSYDILIGTHALLSEKIKFDKLGLVVIDEQQRFGVEQRAILREKGVNPHFLTMTATPIPRTVFLTLYGDLDLSYLDEMPKGRQKVKTWLVPKEKRNAAYEWIKKKINERPGKNQVFIICPFIDESETITTVKAATKEYDRLKISIFSKYYLGLLHGRLKASDKQKVLENFRTGVIDILVATPVVEVGIDIPDATVMLIEAADRFGLAQLHQLRGRVGRGTQESFCLLFTDSVNYFTTKRLKYLERSHVGAQLAELDLKLRGPGEVYGKLQHGEAELKIASFSDFSLIEKTRQEAEVVFKELPAHPQLHEKLKSTIIDKVTPD